MCGVCKLNLEDENIGNLSQNPSPLPHGNKAAKYNGWPSGKTGQIR